MGSAMAIKNMMSMAVTDLGLGDMLRNQLDQETDEQRQKRLTALRAQQALGTFTPSRGALASLFGGVGGTLA